MFALDNQVLGNPVNLNYFLKLLFFIMEKSIVWSEQLPIFLDIWLKGLRLCQTKADDHRYKWDGPVYSMVLLYQEVGQLRSLHRLLHRCLTAFGRERPEQTLSSFFSLCISTAYASAQRVKGMPQHIYSGAYCHWVQTTEHINMCSNTTSVSRMTHRRGNIFLKNVIILNKYNWRPALSLIY